MWKYLILNAFWFYVLFAVQFLAPRFLRALAWVLIPTGAVYLTFFGGIEPFAWATYLAGSLLIFGCAAGFKRWVFAQSVALEEESLFLSGRLNAETQVLNEQTLDTDVVGRKASEINYLYDVTKEMSESLDSLATFLLLGEALSRNMHFGVIKLVLFEAVEHGHSVKPGEVFQLSRSDFSGVFDKSVYLKDKNKARAELYPSDKAILEHIEVHRSSVFLPEPSSGPRVLDSGQIPERVTLMAHPVMIDHDVAAVLILTDINGREMPLVSILTGRFIDEVRRIKLYERVQTLAITDGLTGVYVRRHLTERFEGELGRSQRHGFKLSFLMVDIDHFKNFNDRYGHLVGDVVLQQTAETIRKNVRELDLVGRYGGEEFGVLLIETDRDGAFLVADRIRRAVEQKHFKAYDEQLHVTVSIGVSAYSTEHDQMSLIIDAADSALYQTKRQGRNKVVVS